MMLEQFFSQLEVKGKLAGRKKPPSSQASTSQNNHRILLSGPPHSYVSHLIFSIIPTIFLGFSTVKPPIFLMKLFSWHYLLLFRLGSVNHGFSSFGFCYLLFSFLGVLLWNRHFFECWLISNNPFLIDPPFLLSVGKHPFFYSLLTIVLRNLRHCCFHLQKTQFGEKSSFLTSG